MNRSNSVTLAAIVMLVVGKLGYANPAHTEQLLKDDGYTDIVIKGRTFWGCGSSMEFWRTRFEAKNSRGIRAKGVVCEGLTSDAVIRRG